MALAGRVGISPSEWENMTPAAFNAYVRGYLDDMESRQQMQTALNYQLAGMIRSAVWAKHMPRFEAFTPKKKKKVMTDEEMYQSVLALNAALGGDAGGG